MLTVESLSSQFNRDAEEILMGNIDRVVARYMTKLSSKKMTISADIHIRSRKKTRLGVDLDGELQIYDPTFSARKSVFPFTASILHPTEDFDHWSVTRLTIEGGLFIKGLTWDLIQENADKYGTGRPS